VHEKDGQLYELRAGREHPVDWLTQTDVQVGRPGYYYDRMTKTAWIETPSGVALEREAGDWKYDFLLQDYPVLSAKERAAIRCLASSHLATKKQLEILRIDQQRRQMSKSYARTRVRVLHYLRNLPT
jgi:hypothetical protein